MEIKNSPWGQVDHQEKMKETSHEIYLVSTPKHGGLVLKDGSNIQKTVEDTYGHTKLYLDYVVKQEGLVFYEEDCACLMVLALINPDKYQEQLEFWLKK